MRKILLCLALLLSAVFANGCQCQYNSTLTCSNDLDCGDSGSCLCPTINSTATFATTTPPPPTSVDSSTITQATEQEYIQATLGSLTDGESAGWVVLMMFCGFAFIGILFYIGWMRVA
jgi:hypothetical protein